MHIKYTDFLTDVKIRESLNGNLPHRCRTPRVLSGTVSPASAGSWTHSPRLCTINFMHFPQKNKPGKGRSFTAQSGAICGNGLHTDGRSSSAPFVRNRQGGQGQEGTNAAVHTLPQPRGASSSLWQPHQATPEPQAREEVLLLSCNGMEKPGASNRRKSAVFAGPVQANILPKHPSVGKWSSRQQNHTRPQSLISGKRVLYSTGTGHQGDKMTNVARACRQRSPCDHNSN